ncbi:nucleotidyltransferase domain-containing protein [Mucilaginibacter sp.]|uniref:nucleotidyltransferase domain-containing protein n=1 Tax=Mucilaginibacter sp. TaxID=1882438 RepID=UPI003B001D76
MKRRQQILFWLKEILEKNLSNTNYRAFIFGSQANLSELRRADIDLGLLADEPISNQQLSKISIEIEELPMLYNIDLVNFQEVDQQFKTVAMRNIEWL